MLAQQWREHGARLLTCEGLSRPGWIFHATTPERSWIVIDDERLPVSAVRGVVSLLPGVSTAELPHIAPGERDYIASEMTAFLLAWLYSLPCPVLNRPTPLNLTGPSLHPEQWQREAARAGLLVDPGVRRAPAFSDSIVGDEPARAADCFPEITAGQHTSSLTVVGATCLPAQTDEVWPDHIVVGARQLARVTQCQILTVFFTLDDKRGAIFSGATPWVDVSRPDIAAATLTCMGVSA